MAEFSELIKNFNKCRDYVRDFFVYGFKSRQDFTSDGKSARTYDNERRRITSWLSAYVVEDMAEADTPLHSVHPTSSASAQAADNQAKAGNTPSAYRTPGKPSKSKNHVKNISLQIESNLLDTNPLFSVWKTKSFTDNDILLHFYLFDILDDTAYSANELADILSDEYSFPADTQLVRRKCNEYVKEGLLETEKDGKTLIYRRSLTWDELSYSDNAYNNQLLNAIAFFQLASPFGYVGNTILDKLSVDTHSFRVKHSFPTFTLEDEIAYELLDGMRSHTYLNLTVQSSRKAGHSQLICGVPLKIFVSARTGRRYICIYQMIHEKEYLASNESAKPKFHFNCVRLDQIKSVSNMRSNAISEEKKTVIRATENAFNDRAEALLRNMKYVWGVSFTGSKTKVSLTLHIDECNEQFILNRLSREGKNGVVTRLSDNTYLYEKTVFDANEMFPWLRTFIGRIIDIHFTVVDRTGIEARENVTLRQKFTHDIDTLYSLYDTR